MLYALPSGNCSELGVSGDVTGGERTAGQTSGLVRWASDNDRLLLPRHLCSASGGISCCLRQAHTPLWLLPCAQHADSCARFRRKQWIKPPKRHPVGSPLPCGYHGGLAGGLFVFSKGQASFPNELETAPQLLDALIVVFLGRGENTGGGLGWRRRSLKASKTTWTPFSNLLAPLPLPC